MSLLARISLRKTVCVCLLLFLLIHTFNISIVSPVIAGPVPPAPTPTPAGVTGGDWRFDLVVDEVGKNSARAQQLLYWVFSHSPRNRAMVLAQMWSISRNIVYVFFLLILAAGGIGFIVAKRQGRIGPIFSGVSPPFFGFEVPSFIFKVAALLLYVTFSYVFVLGLMQFAQIMMDFFIKNLGGCNLFNINFGKATECVFPDRPDEYKQLMIEMERNYTSFVGYRDFTPANQEMANTSVFFVRLTTLTYNIMSVMVLLRHVILWFLLIVSPFLALFMPFIFVRNIGWIWIGVFLQWLFYGPLFALFIAGLVHIWQAGIPFGFDFFRTPENYTGGNVCDAVPFPTSINILWGGPAQTLSQCNSANYIDTYAEYIIALVMLWATILLPWLLLRIFRDYCCDILRQNQATLQAIYNRLRGAPVPGVGPAAKPSRLGPVGEAAKALPLSFRRVQKERKVTEEAREILIEKLRDVSKVETRELSKVLDVSIESLRDIARVETDANRRLQVQERLDKIEQPARIADMQEQQRFSRLRSELVNRATQGDVVASRILESASRSRLQMIMQQIAVGIPTAVSASQIRQAAQQTQVSEENVSRVAGMLSTLSTLPRNRQAAEVARQTSLTQEEAGRVLEVLPQVLPRTVTGSQVRQTAQKAQVSEEDVFKVVGMLPTVSSLPRTRQIEEVVREAGLSEEQAEKILMTLPQTRPQAVIRRIPRALPVAVSASQIQQTARQAGVSAQAVSEVVRMLPTISQLTNEDQVAEVVKQTGLSEEQTEKVLTTLSKTSPVKRKEEVLETRVTIEDYEEVKTMWVNHYRKSAIPKSEKVKTREDWLKQDIQRITNGLNLLEAKQEEMREEGLKEVEKLLPFLLLGGFTDEETMLYLKAKLEAARQVMQEFEEVEKAKEEEAVEKVTVELPEREAEEEMEAKRVEVRELPSEEEKGEKGVADREGKKEEGPVRKEEGETAREKSNGQEEKVLVPMEKQEEKESEAGKQVKKQELPIEDKDEDGL